MNYNHSIFHPAWVTGFIDGEGTFFVGVYAKSDMRLKYQVSLEFAITQHVRDLAMMYKLPLFFNCGYVALNSGKSTCQFRIRNVLELEQNLFPLLEAYPLQTQKALDAAAFREVHALVKDGRHLTAEGLDKIRVLKGTMNRARKAITPPPSIVFSCCYDIVQS